MNRGHFRRLRQQDRNAVAARNSLHAQHVGKAIGCFTQPAVGDLLFASVRTYMQNGQAIGLLFSPAIANIDANIVSGRHRPPKLTIESFVVLDARQHRHDAKLVSRARCVQPSRATVSQSGASACRSGASEIVISPVNGWSSSKIRKSAPAADSAQINNEPMTTGLGDTNKLKLANIIASQNTSRTRNGQGIAFPACA